MYNCIIVVSTPIQINILWNKMTSCYSFSLSHTYCMHSLPSILIVEQQTTIHLHVANVTDAVLHKWAEIGFRVEICLL